MCSVCSCPHQTTKREVIFSFYGYFDSISFSETDFKNNEKHYPSLPKWDKLQPFLRVTYSMMVALYCQWLFWERMGLKK